MSTCSEGRPFRGRDARARGDVTRGQLAGPRFRPLFPDVHVVADAAGDVLLRARAAAVLVDGGVVGGWTAAERLGASCGPRDAPVELIVGRRRVRARPGLVIRQDHLESTEIVDVDGVAVTSAPRTAFDLARRLPYVDAVVAVDVLARVGRFDPRVLLDPRGGALRGVRRVADVVAAADSRAESPPETRTRLALIAHGVPAPTPQFEVRDVRGIFVGRVDLARPAQRVAVEYQGDHHRVDREQYARDARRFAALAAADWLIVPATAFDVFRRPDVLAEHVLDALARRAA